MNRDFKAKDCNIIDNNFASLWQNIQKIFVVFSCVISIILTFLVSPFLLIYGILFSLNLNFLIKINIKKALIIIERQKNLEVQIKWLSKVANHYKSIGENEQSDIYMKKISDLMFELTYD